MSKIIDLTGKKFGRFTVIQRAANNKHGQAMWECECECGQRKIVAGYNLRNGNSQSCGCRKNEMIAEIGKNNAIDLTGQRFGKLVAIKPTNERSNTHVVWELQCDCGNLHYASTNDLKKGHVQSCGCEKSIGELKISQLLLQYNIPFERQKTFETCRYEKTNRLLFFDFFVNNQYLIEFDGIQHFQSGDNWNTEERFKKQQEYDNIKNKWCIDNDIPLIRIPYWKLSTLTIEDLLLK